MQTETNWNEIAGELNYAVKTYKSLTKMIVQSLQRANAYGIDVSADPLIFGEIEGKKKLQGLEQIKSRAARNIEKILRDFPIWGDWLVNVPGIGPAIGGELVSLYYFKSIAVCVECGADLEEFKCPICRKEAKGQGVLKYRTEMRDFPTISSWWHFLGRHVVDGKMPKRQTGVQNDWSTPGRTVGFQIREQFNRQAPSHKYKAYAEKRKRYREGTHPEATKGYRHNMAWNEAVKLFLSHFWQVARTLDGLPLTDPWSVKFGGHDADHIIPPYYFNGDLEQEEAA